VNTGIPPTLTMRCIDINSPYCPCILAETNDCIFCSHLSGQQTCDCNWTGICIYNEWHWRKDARDWQSRDDRDVPPRSEIETDFVVEKAITENTCVLAFRLPADLVQELKKTGAFVFVRRPLDRENCQFPVGIMQVDGDTVRVAIERTGPKSGRLLIAGDRRILVRGPYYNGILGQPWIDNIRCGRIMIVAGGIGQAQALPLAATLVGNGNAVTALLAPGRAGTVFVEQELAALGAEVIVVTSLRREGLDLVKSRMTASETRPELLVSAGPDEQHYALIAAMQAAGVNIPMAATNNATMCCGEGICGSCGRKTRGHKMIRACKAQADFAQIADS